MRTLLVETVGLKPHLETAGEIALCARADEEEIFFSWLGDALPWTDWDIPVIAKYMGGSLTRRVQQFSALLASRGIKLQDAPILTVVQHEKICGWAKAFRGNLEALKYYRYDDQLLGMAVASSLISWTHNHLYEPRKDLARTRKALHASALVYERSLCVMQALKPDRVITFNGRFALCKPVLAAAEKLGIPVLRHERGATFDKYELFSRAIHDFSYIQERVKNQWLAADPNQRCRIGEEYYFRRRKGDGVGWHSFTDQQRQGHGITRDTAKRCVVYFSSSDDEFAAISNEHAPPPWPDQMEAVRALIGICENWGDIALIIRMHPHLKLKTAEQRKAWEALAGGCVRVIGAEDLTDSYALLDQADIAISYGSKMGAEACFWGKPAILLGPCSYAGMDINEEPTNIEQLRALLAPGRALQPKPRDHCLPFGYYMLTFGTQFKYYQPASLAEGTFLDERLGWDPDWIYWLRRQGWGRRLRKMLPLRR